MPASGLTVRLDIERIQNAHKPSQISLRFPSELAYVLAGRSRLITYWLIFFDGEQALKDWSAADGPLREPTIHRQTGGWRPKERWSRVPAATVVGMIADVHRQTALDKWQVIRLRFGCSVDIIDLDYGPLNLYRQHSLDT
jgi:hypothetical protein